MSFLNNNYYNNYESTNRINIIKKFIKKNPTNISFLWNDQYYINTKDDYNFISGQLIMEYCENLTWRPLTYETPTNEVYCYLVDQCSEVYEFISSYEYADSFIKTKEDEISETEFYNCIGEHFGKTSDQIVNEIIKDMIEDGSEYNYNNKRNRKNRFTKSYHYTRKPNEFYDSKEIVHNTGSLSDNYYEKTDEEDLDKGQPEYSEEPDGQDEFYHQDDKKKKR